MNESALGGAVAEAFELRAGALRIALRPDLGGCIAGLWHHGVPVLRSTEPELLALVRKAASYPLVPYSNRIAQGRFAWQGRPYQLALNFDDSPHPLHGVGWQSRWNVEARQGPRGPAEVALKLPTQLVPQPGVDADVAHLAYDHCFEGWSGPARIRDERFTLTLRSSLGRLVIYTPADAEYFAVEPVSHVTNAINQPAPSALGLVTLQPGQSHQAWMTLDVQPTH